MSVNLSSMSTEDPFDGGTQENAPRSAPIGKSSSLKDSFQAGVTRNVLANAGNSVLSGARGVGNYVAHNPMRLKIFSFVGSLAVLTISIVSFLNVFNVASPALYVMNAYMMIFAFVLAVAESNASWPGVEKLQNVIYEQFGFLKNNLGRGIFLIFMGTLWISSWTFWLGFVGLYLCCVGIGYIVIHFLHHTTEESSQHTPSVPTSQQCSGNGQCVRAAVSAENTEHDISEASFTCRCYDGFFGVNCEELDEQAAKLAGESDGYRVVRRTTIIHHRSPYISHGYGPAIVPMPMVIPAPVAPAPVIISDPYPSSTVVYSNGGISFFPILIMSLIAVAVVIAITVCCCAAANSQSTSSQSVVYSNSNGYQRPFLADEGTTVTVIEETYDDGKGPQTRQQQSNVAYPTQVTAPTGQVIYQQPAASGGYQPSRYVVNPTGGPTMYQNGLHPQTQAAPMTQQAPPAYPQPTAPPAYNPELVRQ
ncbi:hypothetical protein Pmar_PMAR012548 [Perkinsus marinus ATCC 50983]|uniref:EGF-like domain-containing protein n=1 Tax=Perkinsus marinus (strain ATCC 50983 / TXsc) TaxID=423536 RepID=C5K7N1_PERM5|nr:hypothetical protein Pmar_PMAR012548 [Perkinsus marinus ATCC 50983]EER19566.1 hypothetical protein Pmar_PMAR012548 [Perkinsus marinus ATCC 50983]|eukprot:XP_002787770.1 hypothetical protein Pmar_PMAR012548 [Perkinsus marinus ATCC 50983]